MTSEQRTVAEQLQDQARWCHQLGSPLYAHLLDKAAIDVEAGGSCWTLLEPFAGDPRESLLPLRFLGAVHRLVLERKAPDLAAYYPSAGGTKPWQEAWPVFRATVEQLAGDIQAEVPRPVQTNEVARSAALAGGFLLISKLTALPLRLLEVGASAGLNLRWDRFRYQAGSQWWGPPDSPLSFPDAFQGDPPFDVTADVRERIGCDRNPLDPALPETELTLLSFIWPDQNGRVERLSAALSIARQAPAVVEQADALDWIEARLANPCHGVATVVYHSLVLMYLEKERRRAMRRLIEEAGCRATPAAPLAWLRMEGAGQQADVELRIWPLRYAAKIARAPYHGPPVEWLV